MHTSLDSALGRQRRLNQVGETISSIAAPAAAYSLRSLTGGDPKVVRVRRESDNTERDFTASGINSGAMVDFVNSQTIKPLDTRALNSGGSGDRDGDFQIASAAYSLRSLGDRQATVAATGDTVTAANGKYVVQVRRSSDDTIKSFVADEVTDGTLLAFVNEDVNGVFQNSGFESFSNASATGFTASNTGSTGFAVSPLIGSSGNRISVSFDINITNGSPKISLRTELSFGSDASTPIEYTSSGSKTATITASSNYVGIGFTEGDAPSNFTVSNFKILSDGLVRTWYDQSVTDQGGGTATGNHATQTTAANQPKIVSSGSLVSNGIDFDGTNDVLETSLIPPNAATLIGVANWDTASSTQLIVGARDSVNQRSYLGRSNANVSVIGNQNGTLTGGSISVGSNFVLFGVHDVGKRLLSTNGTVVSNTSGAASNNTNQGYMIGALNDAGTAVAFLNGKIAEVIVYASDQTDNRGAYEGNIADHYSITGVPTGANTVNGFVETWYDQSGNGNDVTQTTSTKQPKIVSSGSLVTVNSKASFKFDGTDDFLERETYTQGTLAQPNTFFSVAELDAYADENRKVYDSHLSTARNMLQLNTAGNGQFAHYAGTVAATGEDADADRHLFTSLINGSASNLRIDSTSKTTATTNTQGMTGIIIGANHDAAQNFWDGDIQELIVYNSNQTSNFTALETNINSHYSIF
jgi:hypothetical protein